MKINCLPFVNWKQVDENIVKMATLIRSIDWPIGLNCLVNILITIDIDCLYICECKKTKFAISWLVNS